MVRVEREKTSAKLEQGSQRVPGPGPGPGPRAPHHSRVSVSGKGPENHVLLSR